MKHDTDRAERLMRTTFLNIWIVIGVIIICAVVFQLIGSLSNVLIFLSVGAISAFMASPIVNFLERRGLPRAVAPSSACSSSLWALSCSLPW